MQAHAVMRLLPPCPATIRAVNQRFDSMPGAAPAAPATHYENFPVASLLARALLRQPIAAIYAFARTADDIADEGDAPAASRLAVLAAYQADLQAIARHLPPSPRWPKVFVRRRSWPC